MSELLVAALSRIVYTCIQKALLLVPSLRCIFRSDYFSYVIFVRCAQPRFLHFVDPYARLVSDRPSPSVGTIGIHAFESALFRVHYLG